MKKKEQRTIQELYYCHYYKIISKPVLDFKLFLQNFECEHQTVIVKGVIRYHTFGYQSPGSFTLQLVHGFLQIISVLWNCVHVFCSHGHTNQATCSQNSIFIFSTSIMFMITLFRIGNSKLTFQEIPFLDIGIYQGGVLFGILLQSTAQYAGVKQHRPWFLLGWVTVALCQFLLIVLRM